MEINKVKLLSNYQLYRLVQNKRLDQETIAKVYQEFSFRNISTLELKELKRQYESTFGQTKKDVIAHYWDPFYTAFAWRKHFKHLALLKTQGSKSEAKTYQTRFYAGLAAYMLLFICALLLFRK